MNMMSTKSEKGESVSITKVHPADTRAIFTAGASALYSCVMIVITAYFLYSSLDRRLALTTVEVFHEWGLLRAVYERTVAYDPRLNPPSLLPVDSVRFETGVHSLKILRDLYDRGLINDEIFNSTSSRFNQTTGTLLSPQGAGGLDPRLIPQLLMQFISDRVPLSSQSGAAAMNMLVSAGFFNSSIEPTRLVWMVNDLFSRANYTIPEAFKNGALTPEDPRLLHRLLTVAGCTFPDAVPGVTPVTRSAGCQCIADTYVTFVKETVNMTTNVTLEARQSAASNVLRCLDRRVVWHTWGAGRDRSVHPLGLALYGHCVVFLLCVAFLISFYHFQIFPAKWTPFEKSVGIKIILSVFTAGFFVMFAVHNMMANLFQLIGLILVLTNLIFSAHSVLDYPGKGVDFRGGEDDGSAESSQKNLSEPHPLTVCFWINIPVLLPAILVNVAVSGFMRDCYALAVVAVIGALLGLIMQVLDACFGIMLCFMY